MRPRTLSGSPAIEACIQVSINLRTVSKSGSFMVRVAPFLAMKSKVRTSVLERPLHTSRNVRKDRWQWIVAGQSGRRVLSPTCTLRTQRGKDLNFRPSGYEEEKGHF